MFWPSLTDYQDTIQAPRICFGDRELQQGTPELDSLGLPRAISGNFAVVFPVRCSGRTWAVRCFSTYHEDQKQRYSAISTYLQSVSLPCMVGFQFLEEGIRVKGRWYPVLKMEWVEGDPLTLFISKSLSNPQALRDLAKQFVGVARSLQQHSIAHGDLQHANILVANGALRLIDYDGMYVPSLAGMKSHELGHPNYQHPNRSADDFGPHTDRFSEWVIYLSLILLSAEPSLWQTTGGGDENLIFRKADYQSPTSSAGLLSIERSGDADLLSLVTFLRHLCQASLSEIPALDGTRSIVMPPVAQSKAVPTHAPVAVPSWVLDYLEPPSIKELAGSYLFERVSLVAWTVAYLVIGYLSVVDVLIPAQAGIVVGVCLCILASVAEVRYRSLPEARAKHALLARKSRLRVETKKMQRSLQQIVHEKSEVSLRQTDEIARALRDLQRRFTSMELARCSIAYASIPGIGPELKGRLLSAGIGSAADVSDGRVRRIAGFGDVRTSAVMRWRWACEAMVERQMPRVLPAAEEAEINQKWQARYQVLQKKENDTDAVLKSKAWSTSHVEKELDAYVNVTFAKYLKRAFSVHQA